MNTHEQYITLETARLAKQAGFDWKCQYRYSEGHERNDSDPTYISPCDNWNQDNGLYSAPTQAVLQRWLREIKGVEIWIVPNNLCDITKGYHWCAATRDTSDCIGIRKSGDAATHPQAAEQAVNEVLSILIQE